MRLANSDFLRLIDAVESVGGSHLDDTCHADEITYEYPDGKTEARLTTGCEQETVFEVPYDPDETVLVPEPILEIDPDRSEWTDANGDSRVTRRSKTDDEGNVIFEIVERKGADLISDVMERSTVRVCALDDDVAKWPRFRHVLRDPRSK